MWFQAEHGWCLVTCIALDTKLMYLRFWERRSQGMIARATLDKKYTALYNFPLYYLSSDRLRELKKGANFKFLALKVVTVAYEKC